VLRIQIRRIRMCFGPSGSISQMYGSGSFYHQAKKVRKTRRFIGFLLVGSRIFRLPQYLQKVISSFMLASLRSITKMAGSGDRSESSSHGSATHIKGTSVRHEILGGGRVGGRGRLRIFSAAFNKEQKKIKSTCK
jgi:hypothetical protein